MVAEFLGSGSRALLVCSGLYVAHKCFRTCGGGSQVKLAVQQLLICGLTASRLVRTSWGVPAILAAFTACSKYLFSWIPTRAGHETKVTLVVSERSVSLIKDSTDFYHSNRPVVASSCWVSALIDVWL